MNAHARLGQGFYTLNEAAHYIEWADATRIRGWLMGWNNSNQPPLLKRDYPVLETRKQELSFLDLMEVRFIEYFRHHGVKTRALRYIAEKARDDYQTDKPFASIKLSFVTDGKSVFVEQIAKPAAELFDDKRLWNLLTRQHEMPSLLEGELLPGVRFDPETMLVSEWAPRERFPLITIDPLKAFGQPATKKGVPAQALYDAWTAEGGNLDEVAYWFEVPLIEVDQAVRFHSNVWELKGTA